MNIIFETVHNTESVQKIKEADKMDTVSLIVAIIGAINWGLIGFARFDLVAWIFGGQTAGISRVIYAIVGLAGLWCISMLFRRRAVTD